MNYFKKEVPRTKIFLPDGDSLQFEPKNGVWGYLETDNQEHVAALRKLEKEHKGGVFEIKQSEYDQGKKKAQSTTSGAPWREEFGAGVAPDTFRQTGPPNVVTRVDTGNPPPPSAPPALPPTPTGPKAPRPPVVGRRPV